MGLMLPTLSQIRKRSRENHGIPLAQKVVSRKFSAMPYLPCDGSDVVAVLTSTWVAASTGTSGG